MRLCPPSSIFFIRGTKRHEKGPKANRNGANVRRPWANLYSSLDKLLDFGVDFGSGARKKNKGYTSFI